MTNLFKKGEHVMYASTGICVVEDITSQVFSQSDSERMYYILKPVSKKGSTVYVPLDSENLVSKIRRIITKDEIDFLLDDSCGKRIEWPDSKPERHGYFNEILSGGNREEIVLLVRCMYKKKREKEDAKKHLTSGDETILKTAVRLINEEFSYALGCSEDDVEEYIKERISAQ